MPTVERNAVIQGGFEPHHQRVVTLSSEEILALHGTAVTVIPAPGEGRTIVLHEAMAFLDYNSAAYTVGTGADISLRYTNATGNTLLEIETTGLLNASADTVRHFYAPTTAALSVVSNAVVVAHLAAAVSGGNSPLKLKLYYSVRDTVF